MRVHVCVHVRVSHCCSEGFVIERFGFGCNQPGSSLGLLDSAKVLGHRAVSSPKVILGNRGQVEGRPSGAGQGLTDSLFLPDKPGLLLPGLHPGRLPAHVHRKPPTPARTLPKGLATKAAGGTGDKLQEGLPQGKGSVWPRGEGLGG